MSIELECGHDFVLDNTSLQRQMELLPSAELLNLIALVTTKYLAGYSFNALEEGFFIRGANLFYYANRELIPAIFPRGTKNVFNTHVEVENVYGGEVTGVKMTG